jgi:hypothetical protein
MPSLIQNPEALEKLKIRSGSYSCLGLSKYVKKWNFNLAGLFLYIFKVLEDGCMLKSCELAMCIFCFSEY